MTIRGLPHPLPVIISEIFCHLSLTLLCLNVCFDLCFLWVPVYFLFKLNILSESLYQQYTTLIINWTTPIVFAMPMVFSGSRVFCDDLDILRESKEMNSLLLANHGSRVDWMVGMLCGFLMGQIGDQRYRRIRVGFVCEAIIQYMPIIGWYRRCVCDDVFVSRSFGKDQVKIESNIHQFQETGTERMLFLSPEGVVVDHGTHDKEYIQACREFCRSQGYAPFEYVLTPRYKGSNCLVKHVEKVGGPVISICVAYVRNGRLLNCKLSSPERVIADLYLLNQGFMGGSPVDIYISLARLPIKSTNDDVKKVLMNDYRRKDWVLKTWDKQLKHGLMEQTWTKQYKEVISDRQELLVYHALHAIIIIATMFCLGIARFFFKFAGNLFLVIMCGHIMGKRMISASMESVPFETCTKSLFIFSSKLLDMVRQMKTRNAKKKEF
mmetsp:Transcript_28313/g.44035  ORF Transcript_28313/g.44035 Transcript_28313/m.44035 type:complete len:437 (-) Transcript_28313:112-1422(-)